MARRIPPEAKTVLAILPSQLHAILRSSATKYANDVGGRLNINRELVQRLYRACRNDLSESDRHEVEAFISRL